MTFHDEVMGVVAVGRRSQRSSVVSLDHIWVSSVLGLTADRNLCPLVEEGLARLLHCKFFFYCLLHSSLKESTICKE